jgi:hypothetical protein
MRPSAEVDRIVVIKPTRSGGTRAKEVYHDDLLNDSDDDDITVRVITRDSRGRRVVIGGDDRPKRTSKRLRPMEKALRKGAKRQARVADLYLALHDRSNRRKKNGWIKDFGRNVVKAYRRGLKIRFN